MSTRTRISLFILLLLGLHALPVLSYQGYRQTRWPILAWAMYARSIPAGPIEVTMRTIIQTTADGRHQEVSEKYVGLSGPTFRNMFLVPLANGDSSAARALLARIAARQTEPVVELRLETTRYRLVDTGVVRITSPAMIYPASPSPSR
jgi:hypothetical protein